MYLNVLFLPFYGAVVSGLFGRRVLSFTRLVSPAQFAVLLYFVGFHRNYWL